MFHKLIHPKRLIPTMAFLFIVTWAVGVFADEHAQRQEISFDQAWRFARFGLQADGSRVPEPGMAQRMFKLTASSEEAGKGNVAAAAMDGNPETRWCASGPGGGQWLAIDLGVPHAVAGIKIQWETDAALPFVAECRTDGGDWKPLPLSARFIRIRITGGTAPTKWASIREVSLTGADGKAIENQELPAAPPPQTPKFDDSTWRQLNLPHDWAIEGPFRYDLEGATGKLPWQGIGWYRKHFTAPADAAGKRVFLDFDGAMAHALVYCNGQLVGGWPYGYASFRVELTDALKFGQENILAVRLDTESVGSRWYPGAGIYRHVHLVTVNPVHIAHWGVFVTTEGNRATVAVAVDNQGTQSAPVTIGVEIAGKTATAEIPALAPGATGEGKLSVEIPDARLWSPESPNLYTAHVTVSLGGKIVDEFSQKFGFRTIQFTHDDGLHLNGKRVQIRGTCNHHDLGALGAAVNARASERQLEILKSFGCNAIRTSHNPPSPELLDAADRLGFLVMDELCDCWTVTKRAGDYSSLYKEWHEKDIGAWVSRDRNHPSVILWSTGNEEDEQYHPALGIVRHLTDTVHRFDATRPVTFGASYPSQSAMNGTELQVDVHGMNYAAGCYGGPDFYGKFLAKPGHEKLAGYSSESSSTISSRGEYPPQCDPWQVSSYDQGVGWGSLADQEFAALEKYPGIAGEFVWTGFDYLGEPTPFNSDTTNLLNFHGSAAEIEKARAELERIQRNRPPSRSSYFGIVDLAGFPKDRYYLYQAHWRPDFPMAHILPHWNWPGHEGQGIMVQVHTSGDEAELFLNGQSQGRRKKGQYQYRLVWPGVKYQPGELKVVAYKNGKPWATDVVKTTGAPAALALAPDRAEIKADGQDLSFITVKIKDKDAWTVPRANNLVTFTIDGPGEIVATDNGDPTSFEPFQSPQRHAFNGLAMVIVRAAQPGVITVRAQSAGLAGVQTSIRSN